MTNQITLDDPPGTDCPRSPVLRLGRLQRLDIQFNNAPSALPRLILAFSRRRIRIVELQLDDSGPESPARVEVAFEFASPTPGDRVDGLESLLRQIRRMVDVQMAQLLESSESTTRAAA